MIVPALVLIALAVIVGVAGALALVHRLPRNRLIGVRTAWTMSRVDTFRRANGAAAPAMRASGGVGVIGGVGALAATGRGASAVVLLVVGAVGLLVLLGAAGALGMRFAIADEAAEEAARQSVASGPCTLQGADDTADTDGGADQPDDGVSGESCDTTSSCAGACALCPRAGVGSG